MSHLDQLGRARSAVVEGIWRGRQLKFPDIEDILHSPTLSVRNETAC
jgi:hypothetical protein